MPVLRFTYDGDDQPRDLDVATLLMSEAEQCESLTGWTHDEWLAELAANRVQAIRFAWWLAGKRAGVDERYSSVDLDLRRLDVEALLSDDDRTEVGGGDEEGVAADLPTGPGDGQEAAG